ncbi:unnamed protein product [Timema podura]|uniref:Uncharacterized protein n=1 Tax=Timema podura TaxID=61482 RepID=A0ABN7P2K6_TIMPD|nr:unnamed protein product [Timema podura]
MCVTTALEFPTRTRWTLIMIWWEMPVIQI